MWGLFLPSGVDLFGIEHHVVAMETRRIVFADALAVFVAEMSRIRDERDMDRLWLWARTAYEIKRG